MATTERQNREISRSAGRPLYRYRRGLLVLAFLLGPLVRAQDPEAELQAGITLTRQSHFREAIPHFLAARGRVSETFALEFDLALCYVGTRAFGPAVRILSGMDQDAVHTAEINDLLAQAYIGDHQPAAAMRSFQKAAQVSPKDEKLYLRISQAFFDEAQYREGLSVVEAGLSNLPGSPRLLFERGLFRSQLERPDLAKQDFDQVRTLAPDSDIAWIAGAEEAFLSADMEQAIRLCREGVQAGHRHYLLLTLFGEALLRRENSPSHSDVAEAQAALETAVAEHSGYSGAHLTLGRIYLLQGRVADSIAQLEFARQLDPRNRAIYSTLADAYRKSGQIDKERQALAALSSLNQQEVNRIGSGNAADQ